MTMPLFFSPQIEHPCGAGPTRPYLPRVAVAFMSPAIRFEQPLWRVRVARSCRTVELRASYAVEAKCLAARRLHIHVQRLVAERVWDPRMSRFNEVA